MIKRCCFLALFLYTSSVYSIFEHDRAIQASQHNDWKKTFDLLSRVMTNDPDNPIVLYDAGVAAYNLKQFEQAQHYFDKVIQHPLTSAALKEQARFNKGNTAVDLKNLSEAITQYEAVLTMNPHNDRAQHNLEIVKKMQEEQKKQEEKQKQEQQDKKDKQENKDKDNSSSDEKKSDENHKNDKQQQQNSSKEQQEKENQSTSQNQEENSSQKSSSSQEQKSKPEKQDADRTHMDKQDQQSTLKEEQEAAPQQASRKEKDGSKKDSLEPWLAQALDEREQKDAMANKKVIKATISKQLAGSNGQNCW